MKIVLTPADDKNIINKAFIEKEIKKFHKPQNKILPTSPTETIFDVMEKYICVHKLSESRKKNFRVIIRSLRRFELFKGRESKKNFKLSFSNLSLETLQEIEEFLGNEKEVFLKYPEIYDIIPYSTKVAVKTVPRKRPPNLDENGNEMPKGLPKERGKNSVADMLIRFRSFIKWANLNDYTTNDSFKHFIIGEVVYGSPIYITNEERNKLLNTDLSDDVELETQRDIFVFQCLIGCRVSDLLKLTYNSIINDSIEYIPRKTREDRAITVRVPLNETAKQLINKYQNLERKSLFPYNTEQDYNLKIKSAFARAGLNRMVIILDQKTREELHKPLNEVASSHMARRSFIGNIYEKVKDPNLVASLSGHKEGSKAFARYRTIDDEMKKELITFLDYTKITLEPYTTSDEHKKLEDYIRLYSSEKSIKSFNFLIETKDLDNDDLINFGYNMVNHFDYTILKKFALPLIGMFKNLNGLEEESVRGKLHFKEFNKKYKINCIRNISEYLDELLQDK